MKFPQRPVLAYKALPRRHSEDQWYYALAFLFTT